MTMLTHIRSPFTPVSYSSERRDSAGADTANAHMATIKRFCLCALVALVAGGGVGAILALRTAAYFWRFHH